MFSTSLPPFGFYDEAALRLSTTLVKMLRTSVALLVAATAADAFAGTTGFMPTSAGTRPARSAPRILPARSNLIALCFFRARGRAAPPLL